MSGPDVDAAMARAAIRHALRRLRAGLSSRLTYHNLWHTAQDVMPAAQRLARASGVSEPQRRLLAVAAAYHDIGFLCGYDDHERAGADLVAELLPRFGFAAEDVQRVVGLILATRLDARPQNLLQAILADADLDVLGRDDFLSRSDALWREVVTYSPPASRKAWLQEQLAFVRQRRYFTEAARALRDEGRRRNVRRLEALIRQEQAQLS